MIKKVEELRKIEIAQTATSPELLLLANSNDEEICKEIDRLIATKEVYTIEDLSKEARKILKI